VRAGGLKYLQAVVKEGLRIFPPAVELVSKVVPHERDESHGVKLPLEQKLVYCVRFCGFASAGTTKSCRSGRFSGHKEPCLGLFLLDPVQNHSSVRQREATGYLATGRAVSGQQFSRFNNRLQFLPHAQFWPHLLTHSSCRDRELILAIFI